MKNTVIHFYEAIIAYIIKKKQEKQLDFRENS